jgi:hypothetical protein
VHANNPTAAVRSIVLLQCMPDLELGIGTNYKV